MSDFRAIGLSYKKSPIDLREKVSFENGDDASLLLLKLKDLFNIEEGLVVSTCNRTEVYYSSREDIAGEIVRFVASFKGISSTELDEHFLRFDSEEAINQLFRVSLGLESKVLGDIQISNQVKKAYQLSADLNLAGPFLHRLMHTIFYASSSGDKITRRYRFCSICGCRCH